MFQKLYHNMYYKEICLICYLGFESYVIWLLIKYLYKRFGWL